jgi:hypothetical protein
MTDRYADHASSLQAPAETGFAITPDDSADLSETTRALYIGDGGSLVAVLASGVELSLVGLQTGSIIPIRVRRVKATGTTASALVGLL